jgi:Tol biopolymer transport system component
MMNRLGTAGVFIVLQLTYGVQAQSPANCRGIVFDADRTQIPPVYRMPDLYLVSSDGTRERQLTFAKPGEFSRTPSVSPDGQRVVFHGRRDIDGRDGSDPAARGERGRTRLSSCMSGTREVGCSRVVED